MHMQLQVGVCLQKRKACYLERICAGRRPVGVGTIPVPFLQSIPSAETGLAQFRHCPGLVPGPPWATMVHQTQSRLSDDAIPQLVGGSSRCMIVYDRPLAIPRLSPLIFGCVPAYGLLHSKPSRDPRPLSCAHPLKRLYTICTVLASTNRRDAGPRSTPGAPQIPNVFVITLAMMYLYLLQDSYFPPIYRIFFRGAWNLHDWLARSGWSLGQLSVNVAQGQCICWGCNAMFPNTGSRLLNVYNGYFSCVRSTFHHSRSEVRHDRTRHTVEGGERLCCLVLLAKATPSLAGDLASRLSVYVEMVSG